VKAVSAVPVRIGSFAADRLYRGKRWVEEFARKPYALAALFVVALVEGAVFPVPPDVLLVALGVARPRRSFLFGAICVAGSVCGAAGGYAIGGALYEPVGRPVIAALGLSRQFAAVLQAYAAHPWITLILAGFTNIPFCVFSIAAGFRSTLTLETMLWGSLAGRTLRFTLVAGLLFLFGPAVERFMVKHLPLFSLAVSIFFVLAIVLFRVL